MYNPEVIQGFPTYDELDPEIIKEYKEAAGAQGMTIPQYLSQLQVFSTADIAYKYKYREPLLRTKEEVKKLPTKMRKLHNWYMAASRRGHKYITARIKDEHFFRGSDEVHIEFEELFFLYNQKEMDKSLVSCYCL